MLGGLTATPTNVGTIAKAMEKQHLLEEARQQRAEHLRSGQQYAKDNDLVYLPGMDAEGNPTFTLQQRKLPGRGKENRHERQIRLKNEERLSQGLPPMTPTQELAYIDTLKP